MPIKKVSVKGKPGYQWGNHGKAYTGPNAKAKAEKQAAAAHANGFQEPGKMSDLMSKRKRK